MGCSKGLAISLRELRQARSRLTQSLGLELHGHPNPRSGRVAGQREETCLIISVLELNSLLPSKQRCYGEMV